VEIQSITKAYGRVDADGSRYLLSDHNGMLYLLVITHDKERVLGLKVEALGETSAASSLSYLDNGVVYIGSSYGDSQVRNFVLAQIMGSLGSVL
jgi:DNA damage-binding protein 1